MLNTDANTFDKIKTNDKNSLSLMYSQLLDGFGEAEFTSDKIYVYALDRLFKENDRLKLVSWQNLLIGMLFSVIAFSVLFFTLYVYQYDRNMDFNHFVFLNILPRVLFVVLLQFTGFFFLRLYISNELDIKHNKNEMTNLESKMIAALLASESKGNPNLKLVIQELAKTERNFILKKDEKTTAVESNTEYNDMKALLTKMVDKLPSNESKK